MPAATTTLLRDKLRALSAFPSLRRADVDKLGRALAGEDAARFARVNPFALAEELAIPEDHAVDLMIHAVKAGLFDLVWSTVCVWCGAVEYVYEALDDLERVRFWCTQCHAHMRANLDERVEVTFRVSDAVRPIEIDPYVDLDTYLRHFRSPVFERSASVSALAREQARGHVLLRPGATGEIALEAAGGERFRLFSLDLHATAFLHAAPGVASRRATIQAFEAGFAPERIALAPGPLTLRVRNRLSRPLGAVLERWDARRYHKLVGAEPPSRRPYLTAKQLLNRQSFRMLFRIHDVDEKLRLNIKSLTVLFTDLRGSTELYERTGDAAAYALVRDHFRILGACVAAERGAIVKTMGDAIMATFSTPEEGIAAAIAIDRFHGAANERLRPEGKELALRMGLHEGTALVVNADQRLDYFGQTVNIAARVQAQADAGEICITDALWRLEGVQALLADARYTARRESVRLKGIGPPTAIHRLRRAE